MAKTKSTDTEQLNKNKQTELMIINDDPGVETRIAILENGRLEELYTERVNSATGVGNIYKGKVTNVEPAIQAAFVDYGEQQSGFLHITDLHPKYFPGKELSERVGKKIAKYQRPLIQKCLKKGDEILIQVLKQGIGTKGPTLTSYVSIPGRLSVMMPFMDKVGVSRKIENEEDRRAMRKILDSISLPEGFGFILRTAGMGKNKTEIKRDIAYLIRLWKIIEKRIETVAAPCQLYNESDLLVRTIRDVLISSIDAIVVDSDSSYARLTAFLKIASPRTSNKLIRFRSPSPIFHAFDIERQIEQIHCREVDLPSGGRLVIDQTEALVAIDVNSGKSRSAKNSEMNALNTNLEASDEICRQLRLRDLGGIVINDLIDMGRAENRMKVEQRFEQNLARDRARSSVLPISRLGLLEMTRQRIRPSVLDSHYLECSHCEGLGLVKTPEEVAADATRHCGWLLHHPEIMQVELACSPAVGTFLLSNKRADLDAFEKRLNKRIVVRISEQIATGRVAYFAYDDHLSDIELETVVFEKVPSLRSLLQEERQYQERDDSDVLPTKKKRGRRRGRKNAPLADASSISEHDSLDDELALLDKPTKSIAKNKDPKKVKEKAHPAKNAIEDTATRVYIFAKSIGKSSKEVIELCKQQGEHVKGHMSKMTAELVTKLREAKSIEEAPSPKRRRRRRGGRKNAKASSQEVTPANKKEDSTNDQPKRKPIKKRSKRQAKKTISEETTKSNPVSTEPKVQVKAKKSRRTLYGASRRSVSADEIQKSMVDRT